MNSRFPIGNFTYANFNKVHLFASHITSTFAHREKKIHPDVRQVFLEFRKSKILGNLLSIGDEAISNTPIELSATPAKYANLILTWTKFDLANLHISTAICFPSNSEMSGHLLFKG